MANWGTLVFLFMSAVTFSQTKSNSVVLIRYSNDRSVSLVGRNITSFAANSPQKLNSEISVDTLIKYYKIEWVIFPDSICFQHAENQIELDSSSFSDLIIRSGLIMNVVKYGYAGARNFDQLTDKYGVVFLAGGCIVDPTDFEQKYYAFQRKLLEIRNGENWQERCNLEYSHLIKHSLLE